MAEDPGTDPVFYSRRKEISALFPYAALLAQDGQSGMIETILCIASKSPSGGFIWDRVGPSITFLFDESSPPSLNQAITFASPCLDWLRGPYTQDTVSRWAAAVLETPYSEAVSHSVVDALLQIAYHHHLRPHIPVEIWAWLKRLPSLPPVCHGRYYGTRPEVVHRIRELGDVEILKSYFLLVWSEWNDFHHLYFGAMEIAVREEFCGVAMWRHRSDLIERLVHVLEQLDRRTDCFKRHIPIISEEYIRGVERDYRQLKEILMEVDREAMKGLFRTSPNLIHLYENVNSLCVESHSTFACALPLPCP